MSTFQFSLLLLHTAEVKSSEPWQCLPAPPVTIPIGTLTED